MKVKKNQRIRTKNLLMSQLYCKGIIVGKWSSMEIFHVYFIIGK